MEKPSVMTFNQLAPILIQQYERYLPTAFDDSLSILEKVNKVIEYLQSTNKVTNEAFVKWNEIMQWVLTEGLNDSVTAKLNEMVDSGEFDLIINQEILGSKATIFVSSAPPPEPTDNTMFWYEDVGNNYGGNTATNGVIVQDDEPSANSGAVWYDII